MSSGRRLSSLFYRFHIPNNKLSRYTSFLYISTIIVLLILSFNVNYHYAKAKIETGDILNGAVTNPKIANNAINSSQLQNNAVSTDKLQSQAVTNSKIQQGAVTGGDDGGSSIAPTTITQGNLADNAVGAARIIGDGIVGTGKLHHEAVTPSKTSFLQFGIFKPGENGWNPDNHTLAFNIITFNKTDTSGDRQLEARSQSVVTVNVLEPTKCHIDNNASDQPNFGSTCVKDYNNPNLGDQTFKSMALGVACFATDKNDEPLGADPTQIIIKCDPDIGYGAPITNSILEIAILNPGEPNNQ